MPCSFAALHQLTPCHPLYQSLPLKKMPFVWVHVSPQMLLRGKSLCMMDTFSILCLMSCILAVQTFWNRGRNIFHCEKDGAVRMVWVCRCKLGAPLWMPISWGPTVGKPEESRVMLQEVPCSPLHGNFRLSNSSNGGRMALHWDAILTWHWHPEHLGGWTVSAQWCYWKSRGWRSPSVEQAEQVFSALFPITLAGARRGLQEVPRTGRLWKPAQISKLFSTKIKLSFNSIFLGLFEVCLNTRR